MCYSAKSSLTSFVIGGSTSLYLLFFSKNNTNKHIGLFLFAVVLMQLAEYFIWIDQKCGWINNYASRSLNLILAFHIYSIFLGAYLFNTMNIDRKVLKWLFLVATIVFVSVGFPDFFDTKLTWCTKPNADRSLQWANAELVPNYFTYLYYAIFSLAPFFMKELWKSMIVFVLGLITFITTRYRNGITSNSRWCYYSAFIPPLFIMIDNYKM
jgi:hypothetical protein